MRVPYSHPPRQSSKVVTVAAAQRCASDLQHRQASAHFECGTMPAACLMRRCVPRSALASCPRAATAARQATGTTAVPLALEQADNLASTRAASAVPLTTMTTSTAGLLLTRGWRLLPTPTLPRRWSALAQSNIELKVGLARYCTGAYNLRLVTETRELQKGTARGAAQMRGSCSSLAVEKASTWRHSQAKRWPARVVPGVRVAFAEVGP